LQALILGAVVLVALTLAVVGLFAVGSRPWRGGGSFQVCAAFPDIGGVEVGTRVRVQGIDAGEVEAVELPESVGGPVKLHLRLDGRVRQLVRSDARVQVISEGMFGGKVVRILPGSPSAAPVGEDALLASLPTPDLSEGLTQAADKLNRVLGQTEATFRKINQGEGTIGQLVVNKSLYTEFTGTLAQLKSALQEIRSGEGSLGKLVKNNEAYDEAVKSLQEVQRMVTSVKQNSDAIKGLPIVRNYVVDPHKELVRPDCKRYRKWFPIDQLFEPGKAVLTAAGRKQLDEVSKWVNGHKEKHSEVVIAACADPRLNADFAQTLTQKQSEAVRHYLKSKHSIHRMGFWWWSNRNVKAVGCGTHPPPVPESEQLPPSRLEVVVFVPQR
jgi:phospholipid/cholesterol/gamma-HCH transport system substrate-binding protein